MFVTKLENCLSVFAFQYDSSTNTKPYLISSETGKTRQPIIAMNINTCIKGEKRA